MAHDFNNDGVERASQQQDYRLERQFHLISVAGVSLASPSLYASKRGVRPWRPNAPSVLALFRSYPFQANRRDLPNQVSCPTYNSHDIRYEISNRYSGAV
jgi:hypothetical protein